MYGDRVYAAKSVYEYHLVELHIEGLSGVRPLSPRFRSMKQARTVAALLNEAYEAGRIAAGWDANHPDQVDRVKS